MNGVKEMALAPVEQESHLQQTEASMFERLARDPAVDVDKLERLMQMHERARARNSEELFNAAMSAAQKAMRPVVTDADNPQTKSKYASYEAIDRALRPIYTEHGFALSFNTADSPLAEHVRVVCDVTHIGGHAKPYRVDMPADGKGARGGDVMTKTHAAGSAMSYGQRYLVKLIFNVAVSEGDDDGNAAGGQEQPDPPAGFADWWDGMGDVVPEGLVRYAALWREAKQEYRDYVKTYLNPVHELRKNKAGKVGAK